jgi:3-oxoadipate enol-lactonase
MARILPPRYGNNIGVYLDANLFDKIVAKTETRFPRAGSDQEMARETHEKGCGDMNRRAGTNGIQTHHRLTGKPGAPTVILSHGLAADLSMWEAQLDTLSRNFSVLTYDIRGHGGSSATPGDYSLALLAQDVLALMDHLGIEKAHYVGLSLGGMIGQHLGAWHGERLSSLTLCATTSEAPKAAWEARVREARETGVAPLAEATVDRWVTPEFKREQPELMAKMHAMVLGTSLDGYAGCAAAIRDMELAAVLGRIAVPTLVVAGEADTSTPRPTLERIAHSIPGAQLVTIANAAHMPTLERPELCNPALERFLLACSLEQ